MIDIHCHILPGVDDGPKDLREAVLLARQAWEDGITHIVATPHFNSNWRVDKPTVLRKVLELREELERCGIPLNVSPGNEVRLESAASFYADTDKGDYCFLDATGAFVLLEQPWTSYNPDTPDVIKWLAGRGTTAIIPHPERHYFFREDPDLLASLIELGAWTQVSADSLLGRNNEDVQSFAFRLVDTDCVHTLATDAHNAHRSPNLSHGYRILTEHAGERRANEIRERMKLIVPGE